MAADDLKRHVRDQLKTLMAAHGVSQTGLERATGYRQVDISRFVRGHMKYPGLKFLDDLFRVFQYTLADALRETLPPALLTPAERAVLVKLRTMSTEDRAMFERLILQGKTRAGRSEGGVSGRPIPGEKANRAPRKKGKGEKT